MAYLDENGLKTLVKGINGKVNEKVNPISADNERTKQSLGHYTDRPSVTLTASQTNKAISADGVLITKNGWAIAEFIAEKGNEYLFKPVTIDGSVCIFAEKIDKVETRSIDYSYTYDDKGNVATATATYLGKTHVYTYTRDYAEDDSYSNEQITDENGNSVTALPYQYQTEVGAYSPLVRLNANAELPKDGYCRFMSHFQGNSSLKVVVSYKVGSADLTMKVLRDGVFASISTQLGNISQKENETRGMIAQQNEENDKRFNVIEQNISDLGGSVDRYYIASQDTDKASPVLTNVKTNASIQMLQDMYRPFLINHTENTGEAMPADELRRNNWLRYKDGRFAPVVGITEEMRVQCDVELYLDKEHTEKYCDAGTFDAERFYNTYGMTQKLYDSVGNEIEHILRPWETTSKDYSVKIGAAGDTWLLDDYSEQDGLMYKGILKSYREVAGLKPKKLAATLLSPTCDTSIYDSVQKLHKFRSFFFLYNPDDGNTRGSVGVGTNIDKFYNNGGYPRVGDVHQVSSCDYARNNNADRTKTFPFAEQGFHSYNTFLVAHELLYGTNYLNDPDNLFSSGVSSNNGCSNEAQWKKYGGVRYNSDADETLRYATWNQGGLNVYTNASGAKISTPTAFSNNEYPKWMCNEAQIALSFATELGIGEDTDFEVYGRTYRYVTPPKAKGIADDYMNARVYRQVDADYSGYTQSGETTTYHFSFMLRQGVIDGMATAGDIFRYSGGGYEQVSTCLVPQSENRGDYPTDIYLETDQKKFHSVRTISMNNLGVFDFESKYEKIGRIEKTRGGWLKKRVGYTPHEITVGGNVNTFVTGYNDNNNYWSNTVNLRVRRACLCGGYAAWHSCVSRSMYASTAASIAARAYGGAAQCLFYVRS